MLALTDWVLAHRKLVVLFWLVAAVTGGLTAGTTTERLSLDFSTPGQPAYEANTGILEDFGTGGTNDPLIVAVTLPENTTVEQAAPELTQLYGRLAQPGWRVATPADNPDLAQGQTAAALVWPTPILAEDPYAEALPQLQDALADTTVAGATPVITGALVLARGGSEGRPIIVEILLGGVGALVVLALVFGSFLALVPLLMAVVAITTTFLVVLGLTTIADISVIVQFLIGLIGLGVAIDYALLIVFRWREERAAGAEDEAAIRTAMATAGRAVLLSGVTVAVSLLSLVVLPVPFLRSVGIAGLFIPLVSILVAITLLPVLLLTLGRRLEWPHRKSTSTESRLWHRIGTTVVAHRWVAAIVAASVLLVLASPVLGLRLGSPEVAATATGTSPAVNAYGQLTAAGFPDGISKPIEVLTEDRQAVLAAVAGIDGVAGVLAPTTSGWAAGDTSIIDVVLTADPATPDGRDALAAVRQTLTDVAGTQVGGSAANDVDSIKAIYGNAWWILLLIIAITFALLARELRSVWLPLKAVALNVISIAAAYGMTVFIWQDGHFADALFGATATGTITYWVPVAAFAFLFGLSMDYEVFILSRIREAHLAGMDTRTATVFGIANTGRLVTSAGLILFLAFVALATVPGTDIKIFATTLALGILLDSTVVRGVLTPALVALLGRANWWWPAKRTTTTHTDTETPPETAASPGASAASRPGR